MEAREVGTNKRLRPTGAYAPQFATGGDVVYVYCRDGYTLDPGPATHGGVLSCDSGTENQCAFSTEDVPLTFSMRCLRKPR